MSTAAAYDAIALTYYRTNSKPDKYYSIAPTILKMAGDYTDKVVLDAGCGNGIFTRTFAWGAEDVYGWDVSENQLQIARDLTWWRMWPNVHYRQKNIFVDELPEVDIINAPFVLNYARSVGMLRQLMRRFYAALNPGGRLIGVIDLPSGRDLSRYGGRKRLLGLPVDGTPIEITVFDRWGEEICTLPPLAHYYQRETMEAAAVDAGFAVSWQMPVVHEKGIKEFGQEFWDGYTDNPELGYLLAQKS